MSHTRSKHSPLRSGRGVEFDLTISTKEQSYEMMEHFTNLINTQGWLILKQIMLGNVAVLENMILERKDAETGRKLTDEELDEVRLKRNILLETVDKPESMIRKLAQAHEGVMVPSYDPYESKDDVPQRTFTKA